VNRKIFSITTVILVQTLLLANVGLAGSIERSYLSPSVNISAVNFSEIFHSYFSEQARILEKPDTTKARRGFKAELSKYNLSFQTLFPQIIQFHLANTIKQNMIVNLDESEIADIHVEYVSEDKLYDLFKKQGEKSLGDLSFNEAIKQNLFLYKNGKPYWEAVGMLWPTKRAKPETKDKRQRDFLIPNIINDAGYARKDLRNIKTKALWVIFWEHRLTHEFGKRLLESGQTAEFKVVVDLKDGTQIEAYITLRSKDVKGKNIEVSFRPSREVLGNSSLAEIDLPAETVETFQSKVAKIKNDRFRQEMHILEGQTQDLKNVVDAIKDLNKIKKEYLTDRQKGLGQPEIFQIRQTVTRINNWLAKSKGKSTKKYQAHKNLELIVKTWGYLSRKDFNKTAQMIDQALDLLEGRVEELFRGIGKRDVHLFEYAKQTEDEFFAVEVMKNELYRIEAAISSGRFDIALGMIDFMEVQYLSQAGFSSMISGYKSFESQINSLKAKVDIGIDAAFIENIANLIDKVEEEKTSIDKVISNLQATENWFAQRRFTEFAQKTEEIITYLNKATVRGNDYLVWIKIAQEKIDEMIIQVNQSSDNAMNRGIKDVIIRKLSTPNIFLKSAVETTSRRNQGIRKILPDQKLFGINQTKALLMSKFKTLSGVQDYQTMKQEIIEHMSALAESLNRRQNEVSLPLGIKSTGQIIPGIIQKLINPLLINQAV
jgi:hypothetical protein